MAEASALSNSKPCIACFEAIHAEARLCPHCRSPQKGRKWQAAGSFLKWIGGITAVISLVIGAYRVNELYQSWREKAETVKELVSAARLQQESRDFEGGWRLIEQALEMEPSTRSARQLQAAFAMDWLRNIVVQNDRSFTEVVDPLLPALYRGAGSKDKRFAADALAHIGWANFLKRRDGNHSVEIDGHYRRALVLDPENVYARAHWGHWLLWGRGQTGDREEFFREALDHFNAAIEGGRDEGYVVNLALVSLFESSFKGGRAEGLRLVNRLRQRNSRLGYDAVSWVQAIYAKVVPGFGSDSGEEQVDFLTRTLPPKDLLATYTWILEQDQQRHIGKLAERRFVIARLTEAAGDKAKALVLFEALHSDETMPKSFRERTVAHTIARLRGTLESK